MYHDEEERVSTDAAEEDRFGRDLYEACCLGAKEELRELTAVMEETQELVEAPI